MQGKTIFVLLLLAAGLLAVVLLKEEEAARDPDGLEDFAVFAGVDLDRVRVLSIDHAERHWQVRLERDERDQWLMTDPVAYPAEESTVRVLLDQVRGLRGEAVPDHGELSKLGLDPPRARVSVVTRDEAGGETTVEVDLGAIDLDGDALYVRSGERVLRTRRTLDNAMLGSEDEYRSKNMVDISLLERPIEVVRSGRYEDRDLTLEANFEERGWRLARPAQAALDPLTMHVFLQQFVGARLKSFHSDDPDPLDVYGLDEPTLRMEVRTARGSSAALRFGRPDDGSIWFAMREGYPFVWEVEARRVSFLSMPIDDLLDYRLVRAKRDQIAEVVLQSEGGVRRLFTIGDRWYLTDDLESDELPEAGDARAADPGVVGDVLSKLEKTEFAVYLPRGTVFEPLDPRHRIEVVTTDGARVGGELGPVYTLQGGDAGRMFLRDGDELIALVPEELVEAVATPVDELRSRSVVKLVEREQHSVRLRRGEEVLDYTLDRRANVWQTTGTTLEAMGFAVLVDRVLSVRALRWLDPEEVSDVSGESDTIEVEIQPAAGPAVTYRLLGAAGGAEEICEIDGERVAVRPGLHALLLALF